MNNEKNTNENMEMNETAEIVEETNEAEEIVEAVEEANEAEETTKVTEKVNETEEIAEVIDETIENVNLVQKTDRKKIAMIAGIAVGAIALIYIIVSLFFQKHLLYGTYINGMECSGKTIEQVEQILEKQVKEYELTIEARDGNLEQISGSDISIVYEGYGELEKIFQEQNGFTWPAAFFKKQQVAIATAFSYDESQLEEAMNLLECMQEENQIAPVAATVVCENGQIVVKEESNGAQLDLEVAKEAIRTAVGNLQTELSLEEIDAYLKPRFTSESEEVLAAKATLEKYMTAEITYSIDGIVTVVNAENIQNWISVNENMEPIISEEAVRTFASGLAETYNIADSAEELITPTGKTVSMSGAHKGRKIGSDEETQQLISEIKEGTVITREPIFATKGTAAGEKVWGTTYVEVDIAAQHMWYIENGFVAFESDVVTGKPGNSTPTGVFSILEKKRDKVLKGKLLPNGKREYETPVSYWMRVTWSGIGFHDATWQAAFGGQRYVQGYGSHGCINMPKGKAAELYGLISNGCPVIIHN